MKKPKILIIIPAFNEEDCILQTYKKIQEYNTKHDTEYDVIIINDCSTDTTKEICEANHLPTISLIHNLGIGGAVQTGYRYAHENGYDIALQYDGDGQHDVSYVDKIVQPIIDGQADLVIGSRFVKDSTSEFKSSAARRFGITLISVIIKMLTKKKIYDVTSGFRAANRSVIIEFANRYPVDYPEAITNTELLKNGYCLKEVGVSMNERAGGVSSIHSWKSAYFMLNVILAILIVGTRRGKRVN